MNDVLLLTMLRSLVAGDPDTADECVSLASDPEAVAALLDDGVSESYTPDEHALLSEAARAGLVLRQVGTHPKTGKPVMRYVRAQPKADPKQAKAAAKATAMESARAIVKNGIKSPKDARDLAGHLKGLTAKEIDALKAEHGLKMKGKLKQDKVDHLVAYAQGRGSVTGGEVKTKAEPEPKAAEKPKKDAQVPSRAEQIVNALSAFDSLKGEQYANSWAVPIHALRAEIEKRHGEGSASHAEFDETLQGLRRQGKLRLVEIDDRSRATADQLKGGINAPSGLLFYAMRTDTPKPASTLPPVKSGADPDSPAFRAAGQAILADDGFRRDFADAYNDLSEFVEFKDGLVELPRLYRQVKKTRPDLTVPQFQAAVWELGRSRAGELHVLNEVRTAPNAQNEGSVMRDGSMYHYIRFAHSKGQSQADPDQMKPKGD